MSHPSLHLLRVTGSAVALCLAIAGAPAVKAGPLDAENRAATAVQIALPVLAGICAARNGRTRDFLAGLVVESVAVQGLKYGLGDSAIKRRPNGSSHGFPSGHAALAMYGATDLARECFADKPVLGAFAYGTALAVAASRVRTDNHNVGQVLTGLAIGYFSNGVTFAADANGVGLGYSMRF